jgi:hypothetical protein
MANLTEYQTFILLILAIIAIRYMWKDMWDYFSRRQANKALTEVMDKVGKEIGNGRNSGRRKESSRKEPS